MGNIEPSLYRVMVSEETIDDDSTLNGAIIDRRNWIAAVKFSKLPGSTKSVWSTVERIMHNKICGIAIH